MPKSVCGLLAYDTMALLPHLLWLIANYCNCCLTGTWSTWSWTWLAIAALPLPLVMTNKGGYNTRMASHEDLSWHQVKAHHYRMVLAVFHINNKQAKHELKINFSDETLPFHSEPKYLGVMLDRMFTYHCHFAKTWHHASNSGGSLLRQQRCKQLI